MFRTTRLPRTKSVVRVSCPMTHIRCTDRQTDYVCWPRALCFHAGEFHGEKAKPAEATTPAAEEAKPPEAPAAAGEEAQPDAAPAASPEEAKPAEAHASAVEAKQAEAPTAAAEEAMPEAPPTAPIVEAEPVEAPTLAPDTPMVPPLLRILAQGAIAPAHERTAPAYEGTALPEPFLGFP